MKTSWKTTVSGIFGAIGAYLLTVTSPSWLHLVGQFLVVASPLALGLAARDNNVTSEQAGANKP